MRRRPAREPSGLPLLDRLIDDDPATSTEPAPAATARAIRGSIARDLEVLLNARPRLVGPPWDGAVPSPWIVDFGLPPARGTNLATAEGRRAFAEAVEAAIRCFEPRLRDVRVELEPGEMPTDPMKMVIAGRLAAGADGEPVRLDATWSVGEGRVRLEEGGP